MHCVFVETRVFTERIVGMGLEAPRRDLQALLLDAPETGRLDRGRSRRPCHLGARDPAGLAATAFGVERAQLQRVLEAPVARGKRSTKSRSAA